MHCEPCGHGSGYAGVELPQLGTVEEGRRGILATVLVGGKVNISDVVRPASLEEMSPWSSSMAVPPVVGGRIFQAHEHKVAQRMVSLMSKVPSGKVVTYQQLVDYTGAPPGFMRAIPANMFKNYGKKDGNVCHRIVDTALMLPQNKKGEQYCLDQEARLEAEGVTVSTTEKKKKDNVITQKSIQKEVLWAPTHAELFLCLDNVAPPQ